MSCSTHCLQLAQKITLEDNWCCK